MTSKAAAEQSQPGSVYSKIPLLSRRGTFIRLFRLAPGKFEDEIRGTLEVVDLYHSGQYETLSYTWGVAAEGRTISLNDFKFPVTDNLFRALRRLRKRWSKRTIWIDALCIDQADIQERIQQVRIMDAIYGRAQYANVWLGEYCNPRVFDKYLPRVPYALASYDEREELWPLSRRCFSPMFGSTKAARRVLLALVSTLSINSPLWHDRAWVIQEFMLSRTVSVLFGPIRIDLEASNDFFNNIAYSNMIIEVAEDELLERLSRRLRTLNGSKTITREYRETMLGAFEAHGDAKATDPKDKVFSVLGLINPEEARLIDADYSMSCAEVFARATFVCLNSRNAVSGDIRHVLKHVSFVSRRMQGLGSWAVDFSDETTLQISGLNDQPSWDKPDSFGYTEINFSLSPSKELRLTISGSIFDTISETLRADYRPFYEINEDETDQATGMYVILLILIGNAARRAFSAGSITANPACPVALGKDNIWPRALKRHQAIRTHDKSLPCAFSLWNHLLGVRNHWLPAGDTFWPPLSFYTSTPWGNGKIMQTKLFRNLWSNTDVVAGGAHVFSTKGGFVGLAPSTAAPGDAVVSLPCCGCPVVLRRAGENWTFRGLAWVQGMIYDEIRDDLKIDVTPTTRFSLI